MAISREQEELPEICWRQNDQIIFWFSDINEFALPHWSVKIQVTLKLWNVNGKAPATAKNIPN